jgi:mono/diheme cytochrome c family protein
VAASTLKVKPRDFTDQPWMAGQADGGFVVAALYGIPGSAMPAFREQLTERDIWSAVAYIRSFSPVKKLGHNHMKKTKQLGRDLFGRHCRGCHGENGKGDGPAASFFIRSPRNLTNTDWLSAYSDAQIYNILMEGVNGSPMPAFRETLSYQEAYAVIGYLRMLSNTQPENIETSTDKKTNNGNQLYINHCAMCHGLHGDGQGPVANQLEPQPRNFRNPRWMHGQSDSYIEKVIKNGKMGTAMPPFGALLSQQEIRSLRKYLRTFAISIPGNQASKRGYIAAQ